MISNPSSVLRPRVLVSRLSVRHSGASGLPMPKAGSRRPSDNTSIVAHCLATRTASRNASESTLTPNLSRRVRPASAAMTDMHSRIGSRLTTRSVCHSESTPPASHKSTQRQNPPTPENGNSIRPSPIATFLGIVPSSTGLQVKELLHDARHRRVVLRRFGTVEHSVIADHANAAVANIQAAMQRAFCGRPITPRCKENKFSRLDDAFEDIPVDKTGIGYIDPSEPTGNRIGIGRRRQARQHGLRQCDQLGRGRRLVKPLLAKHLPARQPVIGDDLADPEMIIAEDLAPALLLNLVMTGAGAPADHRLLVPPYRKRQQPTLSAQAGKALVVD